MKKMELTKIIKELEDLLENGFPVSLTKKEYCFRNEVKVEGEITRISDDGIELIDGLRRKHYVEIASILHIECI